MQDTIPSIRYDLPWKIAWAHAFRDFMEFFFPKLSPHIDWSRQPRFRDKELSRIGFSQAPNYLVADKLVEIRLRRGRIQWVLVHVEIQAQRDSKLGRRMLAYNYAIFHEYKQPVASLAVLGDPHPNWRPTAFHNRLLGTTMGISFASAKLLDYARQTEELAASDNPFALITLAHLRKQQVRHDPEQLYTAKWQLTKLLFQHGWRRERIIVLFKAINWMMSLPEQHRRRYWENVVRLEKE